MNKILWIAAFLTPTVFAQKSLSDQSSWVLVDNFETKQLSLAWINLDVQNETKPFIPKPQITKLVNEPAIDNQYLLKKPAADGVIGNRKAISLRPLPHSIPVGETYTIYTRFKVSSFPNNHSFGLTNIAASDIAEHGYDAFEPMIRITDKIESNGDKNDGTLMVLSAYKAYSKITNPETGAPAKPLSPRTWYEVWYVINNAPKDQGGQTYDVYLKGGEFAEQKEVFNDAVFRIQREAPLHSFIAICNTGSLKTPYGNGGLGYDDIYMASGKTLTSPLSD